MSNTWHAYPIENGNLGKHYKYINLTSILVLLVIFWNSSVENANKILLHQT